MLWMLPGLPGINAPQDLDQLVKDARQMLAESHGKFDMSQMYKEASKGDLSLQRHWAHWETPLIEVKADKRKGRGVFATGPIARGTLVMASKALAISKIENENSVTAAFEGDHASTGASALFLPLVIRRLMFQPEVGKDLYFLSGGPGYEPSSHATNEDLSRVDVPRISKIMGNK